MAMLSKNLYELGESAFRLEKENMWMRDQLDRAVELLRNAPLGEKIETLTWMREAKNFMDEIDGDE